MNSSVLSFKNSNAFYEGFKSLFHRALDNEGFEWVGDKKNEKKHPRLALRAFRNVAYRLILEKTAGRSKSTISLDKLKFFLERIEFSLESFPLKLTKTTEKELKSLVRSYQFYLNSEFENGIIACDMERPVPVDVLGYIFESSLNIVKTRSNKGVYYTPKWLSNEMATSGVLKTLLSLLSTQYPQCPVQLYELIPEIVEKTLQKKEMIIAEIREIAEKKISAFQFSKKQAIDFFKAGYLVLSAMRVCDNAMGSGELLLAVARVIFWTRCSFMFLIHFLEHQEKDNSKKKYPSAHLLSEG